MDRQNFDALTRLFAAKGSRRTALTALLSAALFGSDLDTAEAIQDVSGEHRRRRRRGRGRRRRGRGCKSAGGAPTFRRPCCPGLVLDARGRCAVPCSPNGTVAPTAVSAPVESAPPAHGDSDAMATHASVITRAAPTDAATLSRIVIPGTQTVSVAMEAMPVPPAPTQTQSALTRLAHPVRAAHAAPPVVAI